MRDKLDAYLKRIGYEWNGRADLDTLRGIQRASLAAVPFENSEVLMGKPFDLDLDALYDKIVVRHHGGVCYEQDSLYVAMLREMGFDADLLSAQVIHGGGPLFAHACVMVHLPEGDYLTDVGYGNGFLYPLPADGEVHSDGRNDYRVAMEEDKGTLWRLIPGGEDHGEYWFTLTPRQPEEFAAVAEQLRLAPTNPFTYIPFFSLEAPEGKLNLRETGLFRETASGKELIAPVATPQEKLEAAREYFGVEDEGLLDALIKFHK